MARRGASSTRSRIPTPGNHEYTASTTAAGYFSYFGAALGGSTASAPYYSYNLGTWHIISLDSSCSDSGCGDVVQGETSSAQTSWLQSDLAAHPAACTLAYWHHPRFSGSWTNDSPAPARSSAPSTTLMPTSWSAATTTCTSAMRSRTQQARRRPTASDSSLPGQAARACSRCSRIRANLQVFDQNDFGVLVLTLHASSYDWAFKRLNGTVVDSGTTACHGSGTGSLAARAARDGARVAGWARPGRR